YLDVPFQHGSPTVLKRMRRPAHAENSLRRIAEWRAQCPDLTLRSSFIVGFPGETDAEFDELLDWLDAAQLDRVGCFEYSPVDGAAANALANPVPEELRRHRYERFMQKAVAISRARLARQVGRTLTVLIDSVANGGAIARSAGDAPEIDGVVRICGAQRLRAGTFARVVVTGSTDHDLLAEPAAAGTA
ncbi:MAG: radical SAM protein, partial [Steroidobacteraceae bacterium]|nr:radical SAM protein [Steroidobacteraceae bacterium]MDW8258651.1 radical SAM protein [Gammaproteobacteria bacterium]